MARASAGAANTNHVSYSVRGAPQRGAVSRITSAV